MARQRRFTRESAIDFLRHNENYQEIARNARGHLRAPEDLSTPILRRYASKLDRAADEDRRFRDLAELRGHTASEHHRGRGPKKGMENWTPPERIKRIHWFQVYSPDGVVLAYETTTSGEATALKTVKRAAKLDMTIRMNLYGPKQGDVASLFWNYGYRAELLLQAAGYKRDKGGAWRLQKGGKGLEQYLLDYLSSLGRYPKRWKVINLYDIFAQRFPTSSLAQDPASKAPKVITYRQPHTRQLELWVMRPLGEELPRADRYRNRRSQRNRDGH